MKTKTNTRQRQRRRRTVTREAARLMYEEGVKQYMDAKNIAARRIFGSSGAKRLRFRPYDVPSNGEIREALLELASLYEGHLREDRLFAMRAVAYACMNDLQDFTPGLIGSVSSGHVRRGSDIDLHVFADDEEHIEERLYRLGWAYEMERVTIRKDGTFQDFTHAHIVDQPFPVELSIYPTHDRRKTTRSSTDGKPIVRIKQPALLALMRRDHPTSYAAWSEDPHAIPRLDELISEENVMTLAEVEALEDESAETALLDPG